MSATSDTIARRPATPTVREAFLDFLRDVGCDTVFGNPGSTEMGMLDRWPDDIRYVLGLHEASVVGMADGHARATGRAGVVSLHSAAGLGNALGNIYTSWRNRAPLVVIAGQQARELLPNHPFLGAAEAASFPRPYVKYSVEPARAEDVPWSIAQAYRIAMQRPFGPTFVSVPADDWGAPCRPVAPRMIASRVAPDPEAVAAAARTLSQARAPVLVAGAEIDEEGAGEAMIALAERIGAPVHAAPFAARVAFPEDHPLFAGFLPAAPQAISAALAPFDAVLVVGAPVFTYHVTGPSDLRDRGLPIVQLTSDGITAAAAEIGTSVVGSLAHALPALAAALDPMPRPAPPRPRPAPAVPEPADRITAAAALSGLGRYLPPEAVLYEESPSTRPAMQDHVRITRWGGFFTMASGGLGYGLPGAVGHALARPAHPTVCLIGDGSFMYSPQALWTAVRHDLDLAVIVLNNSGYGAMRSFAKALQVRDVPGIEIEGLDFPSLARGMGCRAERVASGHDLDAAMRAHLAGRGPRLLEVVIDADVQHLY